nr:MAG TPA: hypothetical protein [Caudoviricetes sp.]
MLLYFYIQTSYMIKVLFFKIGSEYYEQQKKIWIKF